MSRTLDAVTAGRFARIALANVTQEYPNHPGHLLNGPADALTPRVLHPAFYGSYDWHSCVHMHWLLARVRRLYTRVESGAIARCFDAHLTPSGITAEAAYFARPGLQSFERTYGWAWLLALAAELAADRDDARAARWSAALAPLVDVVVARYLDYLPRATYPIRHGMHANSAFGLLLAMDYAHVSADGRFASLLRAKAQAWFGVDADLPAAWEPSGGDFLSPALTEAHLMTRVLDRAVFPAWLDRALPGLADGLPATLSTPAIVSDRSDPQIVHLDGLNLSRAWSLRALGAALGDDAPCHAALVRAADAHLAAGVSGLDSGEYVGAHWLATFATLALTA